MGEIEPERQLEQLAREMRRGADTGMSEVVVRAGIGLDQLHQLLDGLRRHRRMHAQEVRRVAGDGDRREVLVGSYGTLA